MPQAVRITHMPADREYKPPTTFEKTFNHLFGLLAGLGLAPAYIQLLQVKGRKSGQTYSTAVSLVDLEGKQFLVAPRGRTQWVRNAEAAGEVMLKRGASRKFRLRALDNSEKPPVLKVYLTDYKSAVGRFFPIPPDSPLEAFRAIAEGYPVFELTPA